MYSLDSDGELLVPNIPVGQGDAGVLEELDLGAPAGSHGEYLAIRRVSVKRLFFVVSGEATLGTSTITFRKRPTPLSATGQSTIGVLNVPAGLAPGKVLYKSVDPVNVDAGQSIEISWTQGTAGQGFARMDVEPHTESFVNSANMVQSS